MKAWKRTMCLWLPNWGVQRVRRDAGDRAIVLYERASRGGLAVTACCRRAARGGVAVGMPLAEAEALWPRQAAVFLKHDRRADREALRRLARECDRYTPVVALEETDAPESLLLDIAGSSHLFGDEQTLAETALADLRRRGWIAHVAIADGIGAAWGVAHALRRPGVHVVPTGRNSDVIPRLAIACLRLDAEIVGLLRQFDIETIGQLLDLPRGQVASRFGANTIVRLDQALGRTAEILTPERTVEPVRAVWTFDDPVSHPGVIESVIERLVRQLLDRLASQHLGVRRLLCRLTTADRERRDVSVGLLHASGSADRVLSLVRLRLESVRLPAAVTDIEVRASASAIEFRQRRWFESDDEPRRQAALGDFVERLSSRLGDDAVLRPRLCADPQPEHAGECVPWVRSCGSSVSSTSASVSSMTYPVDLLPGPLAVHVETSMDETPRRFAWRERRYDVVRSWGPHRIETGWWRGRDIRRDYYRVETAAGERFWLFHDPAGWFLHGLFA